MRFAEHVSLLLVGIMFWIPALAADPFRWRLPHPLRLLYVIAEMVHKALFGAIFLAIDSPLHSGFVERAPSWAPAPMQDQTTAILIGWIGGNIIFVLVLAWLATGWASAEGRAGVRIDRWLAREREVRRRHEEALDEVFSRSPTLPKTSRNYSNS